MIFSNRPRVYIKHYYNDSNYPYVWKLDRIIECEKLNNTNINFSLWTNHFLDLEQFEIISIGKDYYTQINDDSDYSRDAEKLELSESEPKNNKLILYYGCGYFKTLNKFQTKYISKTKRMRKYEM